MSNTTTDSRSILQAAGYRTHFPRPDTPYFYFEDESILGVLHVLSEVENVIDDWEHLQDTFLRTNATLLATSTFKAWNCYTVLLTPAQATKKQRTELFTIEENFRGTRKIARAGVVTRDDLEDALAPLLPLRRLLSLQSEDARDTLRARLGDDDDPVLGILSDADPNEIAAAIVAYENS